MSWDRENGLLVITAVFEYKVLSNAVLSLAALKESDCGYDVGSVMRCMSYFCVLYDSIGNDCFINSSYCTMQ